MSWRSRPGSSDVGADDPAPARPAVFEPELEDPLVGGAEVRAPAREVDERRGQQRPAGAQRPQGGSRRAVAAAKGPVLLADKEPRAGARRRRGGRAARGLAPEDPAARQLDRGDAAAGHEGAVLVDHRRQRPRHPGLHLPAHVSGARLQAGERAVLGTQEQRALGRAQPAREAFGLPRDLAGRGVEGAHGAVARDGVQAAAVARERRDHEVAQQGLPRRGERQQRRARRHPRAAGRGEQGRQEQQGGERARSRQDSRTIHDDAGGTSRPRGGNGPGAIIAASRGGHGERDDPHPRLRLAVHAADRAPPARARPSTRRSCRPARAPSRSRRGTRRASCSRAVPTACTSAAPRAATRSCSRSASRSSASATACS